MVRAKPTSRILHGLPRENALQLLPGTPVRSDEDLTACWRKILAEALKYLGSRLLKLVRDLRDTGSVTRLHFQRCLPPCTDSQPWPAS